MMAIKSFKSLSVSLVTILIYSSIVFSEDVTNPEEPPKRPDSLVHHVACKDDLLALAHGYVIILHLNLSEKNVPRKQYLFPDKIIRGR